MNNGIQVYNQEYIRVSKGLDKSYDKLFDFFNELILNQMYLIACNTWVAGGALREYFLNKKITTDVDLYFSNERDFETAKKWFLDINFQPIEIILNKSTKESENVKNSLIKNSINRKIANIILENDAALKIEIDDLKIDLVKKFRPNPETTIASFDFSVAQAAISQDYFYFSKTYFLDLVNKDLVIKSFHNPLSTLHRLQKYIKNGFTISKEDMYELAKNIKSVPINEINPVEFMLDKFENPNGVKEVHQPIRTNQTQQQPSYGTNGMAMRQQHIVQQQADGY